MKRRGGVRVFQIQKRKKKCETFSQKFRDAAKENRAVNKLQLNFRCSRGGKVAHAVEIGRLYQRPSNRWWTKFFFFLFFSPPALFPSRKFSRQLSIEKPFSRRNPRTVLCILFTDDFATTMATRFFSLFFFNRAVERLGFAFHGGPSVSIQSRVVRTSTFVKAKFRSSLLIERVIWRRKKAVR